MTSTPFHLEALDEGLPPGHLHGCDSFQIRSRKTQTTSRLGGRERTRGTRRALGEYQNDRAADIAADSRRIASLATSAVYPGSFDPLTVAHLAIAEAAWRSCGVEVVELVLSRDPLGKEGREPAPLEERLAAIEAAAEAGRPWLRTGVTDQRHLADIAALRRAGPRRRQVGAAPRPVVLRVGDGDGGGPGPPAPVRRRPTGRPRRPRRLRRPGGRHARRLLHRRPRARP